MGFPPSSKGCHRELNVWQHGFLFLFICLFVCLFVCFFDISVITLVPEVFSLSEAPKTLVRSVRSFVRSRTLVRSFSYARSLVRSFARSLVRSFARSLVRSFSFARSLVRSFVRSRTLVRIFGASESEKTTGTRVLCDWISILSVVSRLSQRFRRFRDTESSHTSPLNYYSALLNSSLLSDYNNYNAANARISTQSKCKGLTDFIFSRTLGSKSGSCRRENDCRERFSAESG